MCLVAGVPVEADEERFPPHHLFDEDTMSQWLFDAIMDFTGPLKKLKMEKQDEEQDTLPREEVTNTDLKAQLDKLRTDHV